MTTIAWDGKSLAVDNQCSIGTMKPNICKVHKIGKNSYGAICGAVTDCLKIIQVLNGERDKIEEDKDFNGEVVVFNTKTGKLFCINQTLVPIYYDGPVAFGSGSMAAMAGMVMGLDAEQAVVLASKVCSCTGSVVDVVTKKGFKSKAV